MAEETTNQEAESSTAENESGSNENQGTEASAGTENTGPMIPKARFDQVNERMKSAESKNQELETRLAELEAASTKARKSSESGAGELPEPPEGLSQREQVDWYVRNGVERWFEEKLGMKPEAAATLLSTVPETSRAHSKRQWSELCEARGLDPEDETIQELTAGLVSVSGDKGAKAVAEALDRVSQIVGKTKKGDDSKQKTIPDMEGDGVTKQGAADEFMVWTKQDAAKAASQGKQMPYMPVTEIFGRRKARK